MVLLPNVNEAIRDIGGKLLPFGWAKLLWRLKVKGLKTGRVPLISVTDPADTPPIIGTSFVPLIVTVTTLVVVPSLDTAVKLSVND